MAAERVAAPQVFLSFLTVQTRRVEDNQAGVNSHPCSPARWLEAGRLKRAARGYLSEQPARGAPSVDR